MAKRIFNIDPKSAVPKYRQIIQSVLIAIEKKTLKKGDKIPSINQLCSAFNVSRDTVMFAFDELKAMNILHSQSGKGYYIITNEVKTSENIFVLFDEMNGSREDLYNSLLKQFDVNATVKIHFHHFDQKAFRNLIQENTGLFTSYIISATNLDSCSLAVAKLPREKVYFIDQLKSDLKSYNAVFQDFENDFYDALVQGADLIRKYRKLIFVNPRGIEPIEREKAFKRFCVEFGMNGEIVKSIAGIRPEMYEAYFLPSDGDLVEMLKLAKYCNLKPGKKFGIVSFNDTLLKEVVAGGITTISTNFDEMGKTLADMILNRKTGQFKNPSGLIVRNSL